MVRSWPRQPTEWPKQHDHKNHCDHGQGEYNRHDGLLGHNSAHQYCGRFSSDGSLATLTAILFRCLGYRLRLIPVQSELRPHLCHFEKGPPVFVVIGLIRPSESFMSVNLILA